MDDLCREDSRSTCSGSQRVEVEDPDTGSVRLDYLPCEECPRERLEYQTQATAAGQLLQRVLELDWALEAGFTVREEDVPLDEYFGLRLLRAERFRKEKEARHG